MKLWLLTASKNDYDEYDAFVVRAETLEQARALAEEEAGIFDDPTLRPIGGRYQWKGFWLDPEMVSVVELTEDGAVGVVIGSYNAG